MYFWTVLKAKTKKTTTTTDEQIFLNRFLYIYVDILRKLRSIVDVSVFADFFFYLGSHESNVVSAEDRLRTTVYISKGRVCCIVSPF